MVSSCCITLPAPGFQCFLKQNTTSGACSEGEGELARIFFFLENALEISNRLIKFK